MQGLSLVCPTQGNVQRPANLKFFKIYGLNEIASKSKIYAYLTSIRGVSFSSGSGQENVATLLYGLVSASLWA